MISRFFSLSCPVGLLLFLRRSPARTVEEFPDGRVFHARQFEHRADALNLAVGENGDAVGNLPQQVQVMRDHDNGQAEQVAQFAYQLIDFAGTLGIEPGSGFVEKQQFGVERQRAGERSAFQHAAAEFGRILCADLGRQTGHRQLPVGNLIDQPVAKVGVFAQRQADIFLDRQRTEQATMLEHDAPALAQGKRLVVSELVRGPRRVPG